MQEIRYDQGDRTIIDRIVGRETTEFRQKLEERRKELEGLPVEAIAKKKYINGVWTDLRPLWKDEKPK